MAEIRSFHDPDTGTISHLVWDEISREAAIIDPVWDFDPETGTTDTHSADQLIALLTAEQLTLRYILETHVHADHLSSSQYLRDQLGGKIAISGRIDEVQTAFAKVFEEDTDVIKKEADFDQLLKDGDELQLGDTIIKVMATPGHTPACVTYVMDGAAFVGDTLFMPDSGTARCDFPGGDAQTLYQSLQKILALPEETTLYHCHDYGAGGSRDIALSSMVDEQKSNNIHIGGDTDVESYVDMRTARDATLSEPRLLRPSVQVNMRAGKFPPGGLKK